MLAWRALGMLFEPWRLGPSACGLILLLPTALLVLVLSSAVGLFTGDAAAWPGLD